ncbi:uncharacterized protein LOC111055467 [Nilaparvata lugens]|uniref:uncharacterized protein LOC111055467 n=1 Tax=Nilaparvata lugens TaxID=108931 RepID=UPI00193D1985|nr:uncharacterized protein LOC111055467 [Nilaparvata lugens]
MDDTDVVGFLDFLDNDPNFELPDYSHIGAMIDDQKNFIKSFITKTTLDANQKAQDSKLMLNKLDKDIAQRKKDIEELTLKKQKLQKELGALNEEYDSLKEKDSQEVKELIELETLCKNRSTFKLHPVDEQRFQNLRFRLHACKSLTGIRWNYAESRDNKLVGYICNSHTDQIKKFSIDLEKTDPIAVSKQLWSIIAACGLETKPSCHDKEN